MEKPTSWFKTPEEVAAAFHKLGITTRSNSRYTEVVPLMVARYHEMRHRVNAELFATPRDNSLSGEGLEELSWQEFFAIIADHAVSLLGKDFDLSEWSRLLYYKHSRYGPAPLTEYWELGVLIRIGSKLARLVNMTVNADKQLDDAHELKVQEESIEDTLKDILGYAVLGHHMTVTFPALERSYQ